MPEWTSDVIVVGYGGAGASAALAAKLGLAAPALQATIDDYNRGGESGADAFGRPAEQVRPIDSGRLYGLPLWQALLKAQGGPVRNAEAQVFDNYGEPIPGPFLAGELGSAWGNLYPGSGNVAEPVVFGDIAATNAYRMGV